MCHFKSMWSTLVHSPIPPHPVTKSFEKSQTFIWNTGWTRASAASFKGPTRLGASRECVKKCASLRLSKTYLSNKIFPWARDWLPWKRRSSAFFAYIHFHWAHRPWSQRKLRVQMIPSVAGNLNFRKLIAMRSNVNQNWKYDALILRCDKIYRNM